jgi:hypothetical protein
MIQNHPHRAGTDLRGIGWDLLRHGSNLARSGASEKPGAVQRVALANKMARIVWALLAKGGVYRAPVTAV